MQKLIQGCGINTQDRFFFRDQTFFCHFNRHAQSGLSRAFAIAGLEHIKTPLLNGKLNILHIAIMVFQNLAGFRQLPENFWHGFFHGHLIISTRQPFCCGQVAGGSDASHHIFTLGIDQKLPIEHIFTGGRVAGKGNASGAIIAHIAKDH